jgi:hypothetical protein
MHKNIPVNAMSVVTKIAKGLDIVSTDLEQVLIGSQPIIEDYEAIGLYDDFQFDGDVDVGSRDLDVINDRCLSHMNKHI